MNNAEIRNEIIKSISELSAAYAKVGGTDVEQKEALGAIELVSNYNLKRVSAAIHNQLFPEGSDNHIPVDANGLPVDKPYSDDCDDDDAEDESGCSDEKKTIDDIFASISSYFPSFNKDVLIQRFGNGGVKAALTYLLDVTGSRQIGDLERKIDGENVIFSFKVADGSVTNNYAIVEEYVAELIRYSGGNVVSVTSSKIDGGREFKAVVKGHKVRVSSLGKLLLSLMFN